MNSFPLLEKTFSNYYRLSFQNVFRLLIPNCEIFLRYLVTSPQNHLATNEIATKNRT